MKIKAHKYVRCFGIVVVSATLMSCGMPEANVTIYPAPSGLNTVDGLKESDMFDLTVNGQNAFVYHAREGGRTDVSGIGVNYCNFSFEGEVKVSLITSHQIMSWSLEPAVQGVRKIGTNTVQFNLTEPRKLVMTVEMVDVGRQVFILSAETPEAEIPDPEAPDVLFLNPGIHSYGQSWDPFIEGIHTVYLSGGAVLEATIQSVARLGVTLLGRGLIHQTLDLPAEADNHQICRTGIQFRNCQNVRVEGVTVLCSPGCQLEFADCDSVITENVKLCGLGGDDNDGLHTFGRNVIVEDCLIASNRDCICFTGGYHDGRLSPDGEPMRAVCPVENVTIRNTVLHSMESHGSGIMLTRNGDLYARHLIVENCDGLFSENNAFIAAAHEGNANIHDLQFRDCHVNHGYLFDIQILHAMIHGKGGGKIQDLTFENIILEANPGDIGTRLLGFSEQNDISNMTLKNILANGRMIKAMNQTAIKTNEFVSGIKFVQ